MNEIEHGLTTKDIQVVREIIIQWLDVKAEQMTPEAKFIEDLGADSLAMVEIGMALEDRFNITMSDMDMERVETVGDLLESLAAVLGRDKS